jgi:DNA-directed RNA polymerase specialized sigma24 family protein
MPTAQQRSFLAPADIAALALAARDGSQQAWNEIVDRYAPLVWGIGRHYGLSRRDVEDMGRMVWLRLVEHLTDLGDPATLPQWIAGRARDEALRVVRAGRSWQRSGVRFGPALFATPSWTEIQREIERMQVHVALRVALYA